MAAMETSEAVEVLRQIRDIQRRSAQFQRKMITNLMGFAISVVAFIAMIAVGGPNPVLGVILFFVGGTIFLAGCLTLVVDLIRCQF